jgi:hypothetical protein
MKRKLAVLRPELSRAIAGRGEPGSAPRSIKNQGIQRGLRAFDISDVGLS